MAVTHTNRHDKSFYLHQGTTNTGKPKYFFSLRSEGNLAPAIPVGFEVNEGFDARVSLRRIPIKIFEDKELELIELAMKKDSGVEYYQIKIKGNTVIIYTSDEGGKDIEEWIASYSPHIIGRMPKQQLDKIRKSRLQFTAMMKFELVDSESRRFIAKRYCFRGSIDGWISLGGSGTLSRLVSKYVRHLSKESFYDLF